MLQISFNTIASQTHVGVLTVVDNSSRQLLLSAPRDSLKTGLAVYLAARSCQNFIIVFSQFLEPREVVLLQSCTCLNFSGHPTIHTQYSTHSLNATSDQTRQKYLIAYLKFCRLKIFKILDHLIHPLNNFENQCQPYNLSTFTGCDRRSSHLRKNALSLNK